MAAVDKVRVVVVAEETPSSELSPLVISFWGDFPRDFPRDFRGLLLPFDSKSSGLPTSLPAVLPVGCLELLRRLLGLPLRDLLPPSSSSPVLNAGFKGFYKVYLVIGILESF